MNGTQSFNETVLLVSLGATYGGAESYYVKLAKILQTQYRLVAVVCSRRLFEEFQALGIETRYAGENLTGASRYIRSAMACLEMVRSFRPRIAHLNGQPESYLAPLLRLKGLRVLSTRHTPLTDLFLKEGAGPIFLKRVIVLFCLRCCQTTICVSKLLQNQLRRYLPQKHLPYIPTWIENQLLLPYERPLPGHPLRALFVGRVVRNKGIFDLIEAVRVCRGVHLAVLGEGEQMEEAKQLANGLPVHFLGFASDCAPAYRASDLLVFASPEGFEGLPQVPLEAMALGVPCLASDILSIREIAETEPGELPVLAMYKQGDVNDLATQLCRLEQDRSELIKLGYAGKRQIVKRFTVKAIMEPYLTEFAGLGR